MAVGVSTPSLDPASAGTQEPALDSFHLGIENISPVLEETESHNSSKLARLVLCNLRAQLERDHWEIIKEMMDSGENPEQSALLAPCALGRSSWGLSFQIDSKTDMTVWSLSLGSHATLPLRAPSLS